MAKDRLEIKAGGVGRLLRGEENLVGEEGRMNHEFVNAVHWLYLSDFIQVRRPQHHSSGFKNAPSSLTTV